ncbi:PREDICTED: caspase-1 [Drosophila arizonae]|uniref:Caspase-1 n=1 Tax=Drosophila arizonae TaxID=7263 RepID=A0ABM1PE23_DROAR|nr:PREDICTED: caspase-1 [Drosophila arizonae]
MTDEWKIRSFGSLDLDSGKINNNADTIDAKGEASTNSVRSGGAANAVAAPINKYVARMTTDRYAKEYNMNHKHRGQALIFNHEHFTIPYLSTRRGTNVDSEQLTKALERLGFEVSVHKDCILSEILNVVSKAAAKDHTDNDCIVIAVMSHGEHGHLYAKDVQYRLDSIWTYFTANNCPTLAGKPKLFFIQACQGDKLDPGTTMVKETETDGDSSTSYKIPTHADFLFSYSTIPGYFSWRNTDNGSWYIQSLIKELNENGKEYNMLTLLTFVSQRVAVDYESNVPSNPLMDRQKQIPCVTSMLTRILRFNDKPPYSQAG